MEQPQAKFEGWAVVEMFGHHSEAGYVTTEAYGPTCLFRVDTPALPEREYELPRPEYIQRPDGSTFYAPAGTKVKRGGAPARSKLIGPGAIYAMTPCTEEFALRAIEELIRRPLILLSLPEVPQLTSSNDAAQHDPEDAAEYAEPDEDELELDPGDDSEDEV